MFRKQECIALLLAGGQGSRLLELTCQMAKPAVPFGGKYRIIDFALSNCANSGIQTVGVLTQYQPLILNEYIGAGEPWELDRAGAGAHVLPPYQGQRGGDWYKGTANAVYQNISFADRYNPTYVAVLSGDHIYQMDYSKLLAAHKKNKADCTIATIEVPLEEAGRFGVVRTDEDGRICEFQEKPRHPKSRLASMGIYIFTWQKLRQYLIEDDQQSDSQHDFGKNVLPTMLAAGERMFAYRFEGYWRDVGTIDSLWEANMDLLNPAIAHELFPPARQIDTRGSDLPPQYLAKTAMVHNSIVSRGSRISGNVESCVVSEGVVVEEGAVVHDSVLMPRCHIRQGAHIRRAIVGEDAIVGKNHAVGELKLQDKKKTIQVVAPGSRLEEDTPPKASAPKKDTPPAPAHEEEEPQPPAPALVEVAPVPEEKAEPAEHKEPESSPCTG